MNVSVPISHWHGRKQIYNPIPCSRMLYLSVLDKPNVDWAILVPFSHCILPFFLILFSALHFQYSRINPILSKADVWNTVSNGLQRHSPLFWPCLLFSIHSLKQLTFRKNNWPTHQMVALHGLILHLNYISRKSCPRNSMLLHFLYINHFVSHLTPSPFFFSSHSSIVHVSFSSIQIRNGG